MFEIIEYYFGIAVIAFVILFAFNDVPSELAFSKSMLWPIMVCEQVEQCNNYFFGVKE